MGVGSTRRPCNAPAALLRTLQAGRLDPIATGRAAQAAETGLNARVPDDLASQPPLPGTPEREAARDTQTESVDARAVLIGVAVLLALAVAMALVLRRPGALWIYALLILGTGLWSVWEVGLDWWALMPRGVVIVAIGLWLMTPWVTRGLNASGRQPWGLAAGPVAVMVVAAGALALTAVLGPDPNGVRGELPTARAPPPTTWPPWCAAPWRRASAARRAPTARRPARATRTAARSTARTRRSLRKTGALAASRAAWASARARAPLSPAPAPAHPARFSRSSAWPVGGVGRGWGGLEQPPPFLLAPRDRLLDASEAPMPTCASCGSRLGLRFGTNTFGREAAQLGGGVVSANARGY